MKKIILSIFLLISSVCSFGQTYPQGTNLVNNGYLSGFNYTWNWNSQSLPTFRKKLAQARDGVANCRVLCIGDSTTYGYGGTDVNVSNNNSWVTRMITILNTRMAGVAVTQGMFIPAVTTSTDTRWSAGTGWGTSLGGFGWGSSANWNGTAPSGNLVLTPGSSFTWDTADVYYLRTGSGGTINITCTGGTPVVQSTAGANGVVKVTATAASTANTNTVSITGNADAKNDYIVGVEIYKASTKQLLIGNVGVHGKKTADFANTSNWMSIQALTAYAPDLSIICLGINDAGSSVSLSTYLTNLQTIITNAQLSGDVILLTFPPSTGVPYVTYEPIYIPALQQLALQLNVPLIDLYSRWGSAQPSGFYSDTLHPNNTGYWDEGQFVSNLLMNP